RANAGEVEAAARVGQGRDLKEPVAEEGERIRVASDRDAEVAVFGPVRQPDRDRRLAGVVGEEVGPYRGRDEVPFSDRLFHPEATFDLSHDGGVEADPCDES